MTARPGTAATGNAPAPDESPPEPSVRQALANKVKVVAPAGLLVGLTYYFGYVSTRAFYSYFGVNVNVLDYPESYYLVRTTETFFKPALTLFLVLLPALVAHHLTVTRIGRLDERRTTWAIAAILGAGALLAAVALHGLYVEPAGLVSPLALVAAGVLLTYGVWLSARRPEPPPWLRVARSVQPELRQGLLLALVLAVTFWTVTVLAAHRGHSNAAALERSLSMQPQAVVYSEKDLQFPGFQVGVSRIAAADAAYRFRYNGLRPLAYARDRWFLLPVGWRHDNGATVVVIDDDPGHVRVDLAPGWGPPS